MALKDLLRLHADRCIAAALALAGAIVLLVGWIGISRTAYPAEQLPYILSAGIGGLFLLGGAATVWLSADLRDEWRKLDSIDEALRALSGTALVADGTTEAAAAGATSREERSGATPADALPTKTRRRRAPAGASGNGGRRA
jgi:hypothetical protein